MQRVKNRLKHTACHPSQLLLWKGDMERSRVLLLSLFCLIVEKGQVGGGGSWWNTKREESQEEQDAEEMRSTGGASVTWRRRPRQPVSLKPPEHWGGHCTAVAEYEETWLITDTHTRCPLASRGVTFSTLCVCNHVSLRVSRSSVCTTEDACLMKTPRSCCCVSPSAVPAASELLLSKNHNVPKRGGKKSVLSQFGLLMYFIIITYIIKPIASIWPHSGWFWSENIIMSSHICGSTCTEVFVRLTTVTSGKHTCNSLGFMKHFIFVCFLSAPGAPLCPSTMRLWWWTMCTRRDSQRFALPTHFL